MLKNTMMITLLLAFCVLVLSAFTTALYAAPVEKHVYDDAKYMSESQINELEIKASELSDKSGASLIVATYGGSYYEGDDFCRKNSISTKDDIVLLIITKSSGTYYYDIYTYGDAYSNISNTEVDRILDASDVYDNIKSGNIADGASAFLTRAEKAYSGLLWASPRVPIICGVVTALIVAIAITVGIIVSYKKKQRSASYPLERYTTMNLVGKEDIFLGSSVTKVRINTSSGGSGGSGGGGGSSHGGGGGHRGGR
ncbi:MAG: TPM domain-containing protein [Eubacteriales bacterium]